MKKRFYSACYSACTFAFLLLTASTVNAQSLFNAKRHHKASVISQKTQEKQATPTFLAANQLRTVSPQEIEGEAVRKLN